MIFSLNSNERPPRESGVGASLCVANLRVVTNSSAVASAEPSSTTGSLALEARNVTNGNAIRLNSPRDGLAHGIAMVHQHFRLVDRFTVAENVVLGQKSLSFVLSASEIESKVEKITNDFGLPLDPRAVVGELSAGERQRVEIVKALYQGAEVLLLDEPTALLAPPEVEKLFLTVRAMTHAGKSVVFVSHKLGEVVDISDRITVMRGGKVTGSVRRGEADVRRLAELMVGRQINIVPRRAKSPTGGVFWSTASRPSSSRRASSSSWRSRPRGRSLRRASCRAATRKKCCSLASCSPSAARGCWWFALRRAVSTSVRSRQCTRCWTRRATPARRFFW
ncbi:MAG: ATP-binding cassette domain-containing protein [Actinobacteria bacterium]|nr:ATP-binding cassette domain-containing protein [Actinomycetota bacterium]